MILDLLKNRYSCRGFSVKLIPDDVINYIVECGRLSPSGGNEQPWKFGIVTDKALINELAKASSMRYDQSWIATAPLVVALCTQIFPCEGEIGMGRFPSYDARLHAMDRELYCLVSMEWYQIHIPGEHMVLAAMEHGVYSTWIGCVDCERVAELLGVTGYFVSSLIAFGYPENERAPTPKKDIDDITFTNAFDNRGVGL